ncbi:MAG: FKBP-type peptidyl-prolyl cis-trans isomerase [Microcella sp.]
MIATPRRSARTASALVLSTALLGSLVACSTPGAAGARTPVVPTGESAGYIEATGAFGSQPEVEFPTPLQTDGAQQAVIDAGEGDPIARGQIVDFQVSLFNGENGELITASAYDDEEAPLRRTAGAELDLLAEAVQCAQVGSRIAVTGTIADVFGADTLDPSLGLGNDDAVVMVLDVQAAYLGRATGIPQLGASGIPAVVTTPDGIPGVTIPNEEPPTELRSHTLVLGQGPAIEEGDRAVVHYTGLLWSTRTVFDSSWDRGAPATLTITSFDNDPNGVVPGLAEGLVGRTVGSQVIVVIPPELGYPTGQAPATIPDGSTMVFVVDILGIED